MPSAYPPSVSLPIGGTALGAHHGWSPTNCTSPTGIRTERIAWHPLAINRSVMSGVGRWCAVGESTFCIPTHRGNCVGCSPWVEPDKLYLTSLKGDLEERPCHLVDLGRPWSTLVDPGRPGSSLVDYGRPWSTLVDLQGGEC